jgi:WD40 repeat protein
MPTVARSPDGKRIISMNWYGSTPNRDFAIRLWEVDAGKEVRRFTGHTGGVWIAAFSPDGSRILSCSHDSTVRLWDVKTGNELQQFTGHGLARGLRPRWTTG